MDYDYAISKFKKMLKNKGLAEVEIEVGLKRAKDIDIITFENLYGSMAEMSIVYSEDELEDIKKYTIPDEIIDFYKQYEPNDLPYLSGHIDLLSIKEIRYVNTTIKPSAYLLRYGLLTIAMTGEGDVIMMDLNNLNDGQPRILFGSVNWFNFNEMVRKVSVSAYSLGLSNAYLSENIINNKLPVMEESFYDFIIGLSEDKYE